MSKEVVCPIWLYHKELQPEGKIFHSSEECKMALSSGWVQTPADFEKSKPAKLSEEKLEVLQEEIQHDLEEITHEPILADEKPKKHKKGHK